MFRMSVFLDPLSYFTTIDVYILTKELKEAGAGLFAAAMIDRVSGYFPTWSWLI